MSSGKEIRRDKGTAIWARDLAKASGARITMHYPDETYDCYDANGNETHNMPERTVEYGATNGGTSAGGISYSGGFRTVYDAPPASGAVAARIASLRRAIETYLTYIKNRTDARDWHGVGDAAEELREYEAQLRILDELS